MHLDLRYQIGLLLTIYGAILAFEGAKVSVLYDSDASRPFA